MDASNERAADTRPAPSGLLSQIIVAGTAADSAVARTRWSRVIPRSLLLGAGGFLVAISWQVVMPVLPLHLSKIGFTPSQVGILISLLSLAMGLVEMQVGRIEWIFGRRKTLIGGLAANAACMVFVAHARMAALVGSALSGVGVTRAAFWPPLHAAVADTASAEKRGQAFGAFWFWTSVAFMTGPIIGGVVAAHFGDWAAFYLGAIFSLIAIPIAIMVTTPGRPAAEPHTARAGTVLRDPLIFRLLLVNHLYYAAAGIWMTFLPLYIAQQNLSVVVVGWVLTVQGLTYALVQLPTGRLADRVGAHRLVFPAVIGRAVIPPLVPLLHFTTPAAFIMIGGLYGLVGGLMPVTFTTLLARIVPRDKYTTAMGVYNSSGDLGFFAGPLIGGAAALLGIWAAFYAALPIGVAAAVIGLRIMIMVDRRHEAS
jgi:MFS family permease